MYGPGAAEKGDLDTLHSYLSDPLDLHRWFLHARRLARLRLAILLFFSFDFGLPDLVYLHVPKRPSHQTLDSESYIEILIIVRSKIASLGSLEPRTHT